MGDWDAARYLFQVLLKRATSARPLFKPEVLLQVIAPLEGGLSMIERRALLDAVRAGGLADTVVVCEGETVLSVEMVDELIRSGQADAVAALPYLP